MHLTPYIENPCYTALMTRPDLNLLVTLDLLLAEGSVARAARKLRLSPSAMSRALARLRQTTGDPLLVRAGRGLVLTPRALEIRNQVSQVLRDAEALLTPVEKPDLMSLARSFTLRTGDGFVENFGPALLARLRKEAPAVQLRFVQKADPKSEGSRDALRDGSVDLETGVVGVTTDPELRTQALFRDHFIGAVRKGHPLAKAGVTLARYAAGRHVETAQHAGLDRPAASPVDSALAAAGLKREIAIIVGGFATALRLAQTSDLIATVPARHTENLRNGHHSFRLPFSLPPITVAMLWHPRLDADPAHKWLRNCIRSICAK
jgi:DNA-binding transcriptional LysR family regulator